MGQSNPDSNKCGCRNVRCCEETGYKAGACSGKVSTKETIGMGCCETLLRSTPLPSFQPSSRSTPSPGRERADASDRVRRPSTSLRSSFRQLHKIIPFDLPFGDDQTDTALAQRNPGKRLALLGLTTARAGRHFHRAYLHGRPIKRSTRRGSNGIATGIATVNASASPSLTRTCVGIDAVIFNPFVVQRMVRKLARPRINRATLPAIPLTAEVDSVKFAFCPRGIAECKDHALAVSQTALRNVENHV